MTTQSAYYNCFYNDCVFILVSGEKCMNISYTVDAGWCQNKCNGSLR